jgi:hypothetical protein
MQRGLQAIHSADNELGRLTQFVGPMTIGQQRFPIAYPNSNATAPIIDKFDAVNALVGQGAKVLPVVEITEADKQYQQRLNDNIEWQRLLEYASKNLNFNKEQMEKYLPGVMANANMVIDSYHDTMKKWQKIMLYGPRNEEEVTWCFKAGYTPDGKYNENLHPFTNPDFIKLVKGETPPPGLNRGFSDDPAENAKNYARSLLGVPKRERFYRGLLNSNPYNVDHVWDGVLTQKSSDKGRNWGGIASEDYKQFALPHADIPMFGYRTTQPPVTELEERDE